VAGCLLVVGCPKGKGDVEISPKRMLFGNGNESKIVSAENNATINNIHITDSKFVPKDSEQLVTTYSEELDDYTQAVREWITVVRLETGKYEVILEENDSGKERYGYVLFEVASCWADRLYITQKGK